MRPLLSALLALACVVFLAGCAHTPAGLVASSVPAQILYSQITVAGQYYPGYNYFFALDTSGNASTGPVPVVLGVGFGNGWGTLSNAPANGPVQAPSFYVWIQNGTATQYRWTPPPAGAPAGTPGTTTPLGQPYYFQVLDADGSPDLNGSILALEVDTSIIMPPGVALPPFVNANWINVQNIALQPSNVGTSGYAIYDAFTNNSDGYSNDYIQIPLGTPATYSSGQNGEPKQDPLGSPAALCPDINIVNWLIEDRLN